MNSKIIILSGILAFIFSEKGFCQGFFKDIEISFGYAIQPQDRRLFEFIHPEELIANEKSRYDYQYDFLFNKNIVNKKLFNVSGGDRILIISSEV